MRKLPKAANEGKRTAEAELGKELHEKTIWRALYMRQMAHNRVLAKKIAKAIRAVENAVRAFRRAAEATEKVGAARNESPLNTLASVAEPPAATSSKPQENQLEVLARVLEKTTLASLRTEMRDLRKPGQPRNVARWGLIVNLEHLSEGEIAEKLIALGYYDGPLKKVTERVRVALNRIVQDRQRVVSELGRIDDLMAGQVQDATAMIMLHGAMDLARAEDYVGALSQLGDFRKDLPMISPAIRSLLEKVEAMSEGAIRRREEAARVAETTAGLSGLYSALASFSLR